MTEPTAPAPKPVIAYDDFAKLDLRAAKVLAAREHPNADRLVVLEVDDGAGTRQLVAGIKAWYPPETLVGKTVILVANLEPRRMRGIDSQGMLLAASSGEGDARRVTILTADGEVPPGSPVS